MNVSEAATRCVLWKKLFLKISQYSQESCRRATLLEQTPTQVFSSEYCEIFKNTYFDEHLLTEQLILFYVLSIKDIN